MSEIQKTHYEGYGQGYTKGWCDACADRDAEIERLRGLLREAVNNDGVVSTIGIDFQTKREYTLWDADDWNRRAREALGDRND